MDSICISYMVQEVFYRIIINLNIRFYNNMVLYKGFINSI